MSSWGSPLAATWAKVPEETELKKGQLVKILSTESKAFTTNPDELKQEIIERVRMEFDSEPHFSLKYIKVTLTQLYHYYRCDIEVQAVVLEASPLIISISWGIVCLALVVFGIVVGTAFVVYYIGETVGPIGVNLFLIIIALVVLAFIGVRFKR